MIHRRIPAPLRMLPESARRWVLDFEARIEDAARGFAATLDGGALVLDAGAGEAQYATLFAHCRYLAVDLGIGDAGWQYDALDAIADLSHLPFKTGVFDAALNIVTLEHVQEPAQVVAEIARVLRPGGRLLLVTPLDWEEHQQPHDYYRYTRYGVSYLLRRAGLEIERLEAAGGIFRVLSRRLWNAGQAVPAMLPLVAAPALLAPVLDPLDRNRNFTLGHICVARKL